MFTVLHNFEHAYAADKTRWDYDTGAMEGTSFLVLPAWLSALIVFVAFVLIAVVLALIGLKFFKKLGDDPNPVESVKKDIRAVKGEGEYDRY